MKQEALFPEDKLTVVAFLSIQKNDFSISADILVIPGVKLALRCKWGIIIAIAALK